MTEAETLGRLMAHAEDRGAEILSMRVIAEEASELGATRALTRLGLDDSRARGDIDELRELLGAWRDAKRSVRAAATAWFVRTLLAMLVVGLAVRLGLSTRLWP